jgi:spore maturation protein CgeB
MPPLQLSPDQSARLERNLRAASLLDPGVARRLREPCGDHHIEVDGAGTPHLSVGRGFLPLALSPEAATAALHGRHGEVLMIGAGLGELPEAALRSPALERLILWERDPFLLRVALSRYDWQIALATGRLRLALNADLIDHLDVEPLPHPVMERVYGLERSLFDAPRGAPFALMIVGELFVGDLIEQLQGRGYRPFWWDGQRWGRDELLRVARRLAPAFVIGVNYANGIAELIAEAGVPGLIWEVDPTMSRLSAAPGSTERLHFFTWRASRVAALREAGFENVEHLPLAANPTVRHPVAARPGEEPPGLSFVGNSMVRSSAEMIGEFVERWQRWSGRGETEGCRQLVDQLLALQRADLAHYQIEALVDGAFPGLRDHFEELADTSILLGEVAAAERRLSLIARLGPLGVKVWGDDGWARTAPFGARWMGYAGHWDQLTRIYSTSSVNIDIGRFYQLDIVTMRVFDVLACGGFLLAEDSPALRALFEPGVHLDVWANGEELVDKARFYLERPELRRQIADQGRAHVLAHHTVALRVERMLSHLGLETGAER